jgi:AraC-like DNA-binding protein
MEHIEFINRDHFEYNYHRKWAEGKLLPYIDFCWETDFNQLLADHPQGFSDVLFPNIGYTYIINLGSPFVMEVEKQAYEVKSGGFLPRHHYVTCHHAKGNQLFGIKFKVCPVLFEKDINFSEYKGHIFPLAYLIDNNVIEKAKRAAAFPERVQIIFEHYESLVEKHETALQYLAIVTSIINRFSAANQFDISIKELAAQHKISIRTLQRYFEATTGFSPKPALQTIRMRQAVKKITEEPQNFSFADYGYYDYSHFVKNLKQFAGEKYYRQFLQLYNGRKQVI